MIQKIPLKILDSLLEILDSLLEISSTVPLFLHGIFNIWFNNIVLNIIIYSLMDQYV